MSPLPRRDEIDKVEQGSRTENRKKVSPAETDNASSNANLSASLNLHIHDDEKWR